MILYALQLQPLFVVDGEAGADQVLALRGHLAHKGKVSLTDCSITLEWNVPTHHVIEEDPQGPHGETVPIILLILDPLRGSIDSGS